MKAADSYSSLLRGVSQQAPQERSEGQHGEQVNLLSDPVNGLTRRHGSVWLTEQVLAGLTTGNLANYLTDTANWTSLDFSTGGKKYVLFIRRQAAVGASTALPFMIGYNKTDKTFLTLVRNAVDAPLDTLRDNGASAAAAVGKYVFMTANGLPISGTSTNRWDNALNYSYAVVWIRGGAFSRQYSVKVRLQNNTVISTTYTTPSSSFQGTLTTSDILATDPEYTKKVNDRVNAYNGSVTAWIGTSTAAIQPAAIATTLAAQLVTAGLTGTTVVGSHIVFPAALNVKSLEVNDGGDGSLIRGVADEIESIDRTSVVHFVGKVVKVRSRNAAEAFYLKAIAKDQSVTTGYTEVTWIEGAGVEQAIAGGLLYATVSGSNLYVASSATLLNTIIAGTHPTFSVSAAGDADSAPPPFFIGKQVSYLGTFQNRLLVGCGGVLACSKTEDYLNFFRTTALTLPADDAFEMQPTGSEDDTLRHSVLYDQNLVIFGSKRQYVVSGKIALTPTSANMPVMASYANVDDASPISAGGFIFYAKRGTDYSSVHQIQPGQTDNSPESYPASSQVDSYIIGGIVEMVSATGSPSLLFARTNAARNSLYCFAYLDKPDGRKMDSWSRWDFNPALGAIIGFSPAVDGLEVFFLRSRTDGTFYVVADYVRVATLLSNAPYLDSNRPYAQVAAGTGSVTLTSGSAWAAAFNKTSDRRFTGSLLPDVSALLTSYPGEPGLTVGALQEAYFIPTNPFMRDNKGKAIISGRLTITKLLVAFKESIGFKWLLSYRNTAPIEVTFNGRILGSPNNLIGIEPITTGKHSVPIGIETREYTLTISARKWYPFTLTAIEWVGQFFNRVQRF
jgi:hypothetical protein